MVEDLGGYLITCFICLSCIDSSAFSKSLNSLLKFDDLGVRMLSNGLVVSRSSTRKLIWLPFLPAYFGLLWTEWLVFLILSSNSYSGALLVIFTAPSFKFTRLTSFNFLSDKWLPLSTRPNLWGSEVVVFSLKSLRDLFKVFGLNLLIFGIDSYLFYKFYWNFLLESYSFISYTSSYFSGCVSVIDW